MSESIQWIRQGSLIVAKSVAAGADTQPALDLSEFKYQFHIRQQDAQTPNTAVIRVINLSDQTVKTIQNEFTRVVLQAGYKYAATGVIFDGTIVQTRRGRERNVDSYLDIYAAEGTLPYQYAVVNQTLAPGATPKQQAEAIDKVISPLGLTIENTDAFVSTGGVLPRGKVLFGMAMAHLDQLTITTGTTWAIRGGKVSVIPLTGYLPGEAVVLNSQTGLIEQPEATQEGIKVRCLLNPKIRVGTRVQIANYLINSVSNRGALVPSYDNPFAGAFASVTDDGFYRVLVIEYEGDSRGQPWYQELTCLAVDATVAPDKSVKLYP